MSTTNLIFKILYCEIIVATTNKKNWFHQEFYFFNMSNERSTNKRETNGRLRNLLLKQRKRMSLIIVHLMHRSSIWLTTLAKIVFCLHIFLIVYISVCPKILTYLIKSSFVYRKIYTILFLYLHCSIDERRRRTQTLLSVVLNQCALHAFQCYQSTVCW